MSKEKKYISYFQSVITIGIMSNGSTQKEAGEKARSKLLDVNGVNHCFFEQTDFDLTKVERWKPEINLEDMDLDGMSFRFNPNCHTKNIIATRLHKDVKDLTEEDYQRFVKESIQLQVK